MKIGIIFYKNRKPRSEKTSIEISTWLCEKGHATFLNPNEKIFQKGLDFVISVGGDGTVLGAADEITKYDIPVVGINIGHLGFLCNIQKNEIFEKLEKILNGEYKIEKRTRIQAEIIHQKKVIRTVDALNEIYIGGINRTVFLEIDITENEKTFQTKVIGDGLIVSSKTGSTAYNLNAGGSILIIDAFSIVASNASFDSDYLHRNTKAFVTSTDTFVKVSIFNEYEENLPFVVADGQKDQRINPGDVIKIQRSKFKTSFIKI